MKLVEILAKELDVWPYKASHAVQHINGDVGFTYGGKPGRMSNDWSINAKSASRKSFWLVGAATKVSKTASDHAAAIVTRADWEKEKMKQAAPKKNAEGWIRHRGGKCPVEAGTLVDVRYRSGIVNEHVKSLESVNSGGSVGLSAVTWEHHGSINDIMAYRLHKPAEQVEACSKPELQIKLPDNYGEIIGGSIGGPLQWRDRIAEIDSTTMALTTERAELVQKLASEGFALIGRAFEPVAIQPDPGKWEVGDSVECISSNYSFITVGMVYVITGFDRNMVQFLDDDDTEMEYERANFKFHSRPSA